MMETLSLKQTSLNEITDAFMLAFADYAVSFDRKEIEDMLIRRGYNAQLSFGAFDAGRIVAFILNGTGNYDGLRTAYDTGTGTIAEYRGQRIVNQMFGTVETELINAGTEQYLLEVLCDNTPAIKIYDRQGFEIRRQLNCYRQEMESLRITERKNDNGIEIRSLAPDKIVANGQTGDFYPSWQNSRESIIRAKDQLTGFVAMDGDRQAGYLIGDMSTGDVTQIAVEPEYRRNGIGTRLLSAFVGMNRAKIVKVINVESTCGSLDGFLNANNIGLSSRQYEMSKPLHR